MVTWFTFLTISCAVRPTKICVTNKADMNLKLLWEPLRSSHQNLLHSHVTFPKLQAPTLDSHPSLQLRYARHDIPAFSFSPSPASTFPHCFRRTISNKKKKSSHSICEISEHCLCRHVPCAFTLEFQKHSFTQLGADGLVLNFSTKPPFLTFNYKLCASSFLPPATKRLRDCESTRQPLIGKTEI